MCRRLCLPVWLVLFVVGVAVGCDSVLPFERTSQLDPKSDRYVPQAPDTVTARIVAPDVVEVAWASASLNEDGFTVQRSKDGGPFRERMQVEGGRTAVYDTLSIQGEYQYAVFPTYRSRVGEASESNPVSVTGWVQGAPRTNTSPREDATSVKVAELGDGRVLFVSPDLAEVYDPVTQVWSRIPHPGPISFRAVFPTNDYVRLIPLADGRAFYMGISTEESRLRLAVYDPLENTWTPVEAPDLSIGRKFITEETHITELSDGRILLVGDRVGANDVYMYAMTWSPGDASFREVASPPFARPRPLVSLPKNDALLLGFLRVSALFDGDTNTWTTLSDGPANYNETPAFASLPDGHVVTFGNRGAFWTYTPEDRNWTVQSLPEGLTETGYTVMTALPDGSALGLFDTYNSTQRIGRYDPSTGEWEVGSATGGPSSPPFLTWIEGLRPGSSYDAVGVSRRAEDVYWYRYLPAGE